MRTLWCRNVSLLSRPLAYMHAHSLLTLVAFPRTQWRAARLCCRASPRLPEANHQERPKASPGTAEARGSSSVNPLAFVCFRLSLCTVHPSGPGCIRTHFLPRSRPCFPFDLVLLSLANLKQPLLLMLLPLLRCSSLQTHQTRRQPCNRKCRCWSVHRLCSPAVLT